MYLDLCGEYSASMFSHPHPVITKAMHSALDSGFGLVVVNRFEGRLAALFCSRFPSIEKIGSPIREQRRISPLLRLSRLGEEEHHNCVQGRIPWRIGHLQQG